MPSITASVESEIAALEFDRASETVCNALRHARWLLRRAGVDVGFLEWVPGKDLPRIPYRATRPDVTTFWR